MDYIENIGLLERAVSDHAFIRNIKYHRLPDGTLDIAGNKRLWNSAVAPFKRIKLWERTPGWEEGIDPLQEEPYIIFIPAPAGSEKRAVILVSHGGGFEIRTGCEGANAAWYFHKAGYPTAILSYRLLPYSRVDALRDITRAVRLLRDRSEELGIGQKVAVMGFSAGGMLSGNLATHCDDGDPASDDPVERRSSRPDACVVGYGAMSELSFPGPFMVYDPDSPTLFGRSLREKFYLSIEKHVTPDTCPFFIWQTLSDDGRHGMCLAKACQDAGVPYELHIFEGGVHGLAMADGENDLAADVPHIHSWGKLCLEWLEMHGIC